MPLPYNRYPIYALSDVTGLTEWVDYIPVQVETDGRAGSFDNEGYIVSDSVLTDNTGLVAWVDYIPVYEVTGRSTPWYVGPDGYIPYEEVGGSAPAWTPASLFASSEVGAWYDPSDLGTLFQDSAGTTPVTAAGQPVGLMQDKSGNGFHLINETSGERPTLAQDALGKYYLDFSASDNLVSTATFSLSIPAFIAAAVDTTLNSASTTVFGARSSSTSAADIYHLTGTNSYYGAQTQDATEGDDRVACAAASGPSGTTAVIDAILGDGTNYIRVNGGTDVSAATSVTSAFTKSSLRITTNSADGLNSTTGTMKLYAAIIVNREMTTEERDSATNWLKSKCGIYNLERYAFDVFGIAGQSNGTGQGDAASSPDVEFGTAAAWVGGSLIDLGDPGSHYTGNISNTGSAWPAFANRYYQLIGRRPLIVGGCVSGTAISAWDSGFNTYGTSLVNKVNAAIAYVEGKGGTANFRGIIHLGGESDAIAGASQATVEASLASLFGKFQSAFSDTSMPFWIMSIDKDDDPAHDTGFTNARAAMVAFAASEADAELVMPYQGFYDAGLFEDNVHWNQTALNTGGAIAAENIALAIGSVAPYVDTVSINALKSGTAFTQDLEATGSGTITWSVVSGALPSGLSLSSTGTLSGTPDTEGEASFTVRATNSYGYGERSYTVTVAPAVVFTPVDLFGSTENGIWIDPSDFSSMWQDTSGTTAVTAVGQSVQRIDDKSGNARHLTYDTAAPTLQQDASGNYYLEFNASERMYSASSATDVLNTGSGCAMYVACYPESASAIEYVIAETDGTRFACIYADTRSSSFRLVNWQIDGSSEFISWPSGLAENTPYVWGANGNGTTVTARSNGADVSGSTSEVGTYIGDTQIQIGAQSGAFPFNGRIYGAVMIDRALTAGEIADLEAYLADKSGVTLP